ncbi:MAG: crosslink repair DNA glycosylase YcaQ family protein [Myxococcota bacterium]
MRRLTLSEGRRLLLARTDLGLRHDDGDGAALLDRLRMIQLDPLDPMGTNADLVAMARLRNYPRGQVLKDGYAVGFEHFAKERCLLHFSAFDHYARVAPNRPNFRCTQRLQRISNSMLDAARDALRRGPLRASELDLGQVRAIDYHGWKSTRNAGRMALEVLLRRCEAVVLGREGRDKIYGAPADSAWWRKRVKPGEFAFDAWSVLERVRASGMLSERAGIWWSSIQTRDVAHALVEGGRLERVAINGSVYFVEPGVDDALAHFTPSGEMRVLGPLDPLLWNRGAVRDLFGFEYLWEVYKPAHARRWGWYVMPLLLGEQLVGRLEGRVRAGTLQVDRVWKERPFNTQALDECLAEHAAACGCAHYERPVRFDVEA